MRTLPNDLSHLPREGCWPKPLGTRGGGFDILSALRTRQRHVSVGTSLLAQSTPMRSAFCVLGGWLAQDFTFADGRRQILDFRLPLDFITPYALPADYAPFGIAAITDAVVVELPLADLQALMSESSEAQGFIRAFEEAHQVRMVQHMARLGRANADEIVSYFLLELYYRLKALGELLDHTYRLPITQQILGDATGLTNIHISRTLHKLKAAGMIAMLDHTIVLKDVEALSRLCDLNTETQWRHLYAQAPEAAVDERVGR